MTYFFQPLTVCLFMLLGATYYCGVSASENTENIPPELIYDYDYSSPKKRKRNDDTETKPRKRKKIIDAPIELVTRSDTDLSETEDSISNAPSQAPDIDSLSKEIILVINDKLGQNIKKYLDINRKNIQQDINSVFRDIDFSSSEKTEDQLHQLKSLLSDVMENAGNKNPDQYQTLELLNTCSVIIEAIRPHGKPTAKLNQNTIKQKAIDALHLIDTILDSAWFSRLRNSTLDDRSKDGLAFFFLQKGIILHKIADLTKKPTFRKKYKIQALECLLESIKLSISESALSRIKEFIFRYPQQSAKDLVVLIDSKTKN